MLSNGSSNYRANFDNRNKIIWNNTNLRLFNYNHPNSLDLLQLNDAKYKGFKSRKILNDYDIIYPQQDPEVIPKC